MHLVHHHSSVSLGCGGDGVAPVSEVNEHQNQPKSDLQQGVDHLEAQHVLDVTNAILRIKDSLSVVVHVREVLHEYFCPFKLELEIFSVLCDVKQVDLFQSDGEKQDAVEVRLTEQFASEQSVVSDHVHQLLLFVLSDENPTGTVPGANGDKTEDVVQNCSEDGHGGGDDDVLLTLVEERLRPLDFLVEEVDFVDLEILLALPEILVKELVLQAENVVA